MVEIWVGTDKSKNDVLHLTDRLFKESEWSGVMYSALFQVTWKYVLWLKISQMCINF